MFEQATLPTTQPPPPPLTMPITKKDRIAREHKKADAAGTRVQVHKNGTPVKAAKAMTICAFCRKDLVAENTKILEQHASTHNDQWPKEKCFPKEFPA
ncbi:hypothetical protein MBLNU13_g11365t1 [Cladosporium sp. NU13]